MILFQTVWLHLFGGSFSNTDWFVARGQALLSLSCVFNQQIQFTEAEDSDGEMEDEDGEHIITTTEDYEGIITQEALAEGQTQIIQTKEGPVQLVAVRIPNDKGEEEEAWIKIVPESSAE